MSRRTSLLAILPLVALVLIMVMRRDPPAQPEQVAPRVAEAPAQPIPSAATEALADPSERASIADPAPNPAPGLTVSGTVRDAKSTLAGATVSLWLEERSPAPLGKVVTGADGAFSFPVETDRTYMLACTAPGHDEGGGEARPGKPFEIYLASREPTTELYGRVQESGGKPVTDFTIGVMSIQGNSWQSVHSSDPIHSPTGEFRIQVRLRTGSSTLSVQAFASGFDPGFRRVEGVREGTSTDVSAIELKALRAALEGIVEDASTKKPIARAHLEALCNPRAGPREVMSGADGTFQFSVLPEQVLSAVSVSAEGYAPRVIEVGHLDGLLHVELSAGATIRGVVSCVGDAKLDELSVVCWEQKERHEGLIGSGRLRGSARLGPNGEYELQHVAVAPLYVGLERRLSGVGRHEVHYGQIQSVSPKEGQKVEVDFRIGGLFRVSVPIRPMMKRAVVLGQLLDASGQLVGTSECEWGSDMTFRDVPRGHYEIHVCIRDVEHFLARAVDVDQQDVELPDWDITDLRGKK